MRTETVRRVAAGLAFALASSIGLVALGAPAQAAGSPPVTKPDRIKLQAGEGTNVDVLKNDTDADGDELEICRVTEPKRHRHMSVEVEDNELLIFASSRASGTYTVDYYACDFSTLTRGTVTVTVKKAPKVRVQVRKIASRPGKLRVTNKGNRQVAFIWGAITDRDSDEVIDGERLVARKRSIVISVRRKAVLWVAFHPGTHSQPVLGEVRGIKLRPRTKVLPPSLPLSELLSDRTGRTGNLLRN